MRYLRAMIVIASFGVGLIGHRAHAADEDPGRWEEILQRVARSLDQSELSDQQKQRVLANLKQTLSVAAEAERQAAATTEQLESADQGQSAEQPAAEDREEEEASQSAATASERRQMRAEQRERRREVAREMAREAIDEAIESRREARPQRGRSLESRESRESQESQEREQRRQRVSDREQGWNRWPSPFAIGVILETGDGEDGQQQLKISEVFPDSPAAEAGLEDGDVVVKIEGRHVPDPHEVTWRVHRAGMEGDTLLLEVQRDEQTHTIEVRPAARRFAGRSIAAVPWGFAGPPAMPGFGPRSSPREAQPSDRQELVELQEQVQMLREETKELQDLVRQLLQQQAQAPDSD